MTLDQEKLQLAERANYDLLSSLYLRYRTKIPGGVLFRADDINDPEWNHAALIDLRSHYVSDFIHHVESFYGKHELNTTLVVSPFSSPGDLAGRLLEEGFFPCYRHSWHFLNLKTIPSVELSDTARISVVRTEEEMHSFVRVFTNVYSLDLETEEPIPLSSGYASCLLRSFQNLHPGIEVTHYLATIEGNPAGISTSLHGRAGYLSGISGLYNLAVRPKFRCRGLGSMLVRKRARDAMLLGQEIIFLQTERASVARGLGRHGFERAFDTVGMSKRWCSTRREV